jgi:hypothetical protein
MIAVVLLLIPFLGALFAYLSSKKYAFFTAVVSSLLSAIATIFAYQCFAMQ